MLASSSSRALARTTQRPAARAAAVAPRLSRRQVQVKALFGGGNKEGGGGGLPNPFDMGKLMESVKKAQQMVQVETARVQKELDETDFEGYDEDETVRVVLTGNQAPKAVEVTAEAIALGEEELSARLTAAMKDAHTKSVAGMREKMKGLAASLGLPAGGGMPGM